MPASLDDQKGYDVIRMAEAELLKKAQRTSNSTVKGKLSSSFTP